MKIAYVAGAYRAETINEVAINIQKAEQIARQLWQMGYAVICPHKNSAFFDGLVPDAQILEAYIEILSRCDLLVLVGSNYAWSTGSTEEIKKAREYGIDIFKMYVGGSKLYEYK